MSRAIIAAVALAAAAPSHASTFTTLHAFAGGTADGTGPNSLALIGGTIYGTTEAGGSTSCAVQNVTGCGIIFTVNPATGMETTLIALDPAAQFPFSIVGSSGTLFTNALYGGVTGTLIAVPLRKPLEHVVYGFAGAQGGAGQGPAGPFLAVAGSLVGSTVWGGTGSLCPNNGYGGCGTVYAVNVNTGQQTYQYSFATPQNGEAPNGIVRGPGSMIYGSTYFGGTSSGCPAQGDLGCGVIFAFDTKAGKETLLHRFTGGADGGNPTAIALEGTTIYGITSSTLFAYDSTHRRFATLHSFAGGADGMSPSALATTPTAVYGTTTAGGTANNGTIWRFDLRTKKQQVLYSFKPAATDGQNANSLISLGAALYGTTRFGGKNFGGTVFKFVP